MANPAFAGARITPRHAADPRTEVASFDSARFRVVLGHFATGVVAITAVDPSTNTPTGLAANSFTSVSLDPPLVSFCVAHTSSTWPALREAGELCVNVLSHEQLSACQQLATKGGEKFRGLSWTPAPSGAPILDGALAWIDCVVESEYVAGDHVIVVCAVRHLASHHSAQQNHAHRAAPLLFFRGNYGSFAG